MISYTEELKESDKRFRSLINSAINSVLIIDSNGKIILWNNSAEKNFLYAEEEVLGNPLTIIIPERYRETHIKGLNRVTSTGESRVINKTVEMYGLRKDGSEFPIELSISSWKTEKGTYYGGIIQNITERKRSEEALRESEEIFKCFMEYSPVYVFIKDKNIRALRLSKNFETMLGKPVAELLGKTMNDLFPSELAKSMVADDMRILKKGKVITVEEELNGRSYSTIKFPILIDGEPRYLAGYTIDTTESKKVEALKIENERLAIADKAKSEFLSNMSHELRTPLTAIIGFSELMEQGIMGELNEKQKHYINNINASGTFLLALINDILDLTKIEIGKMDLAHEKMSVPASIKETFSLIKEKAFKHNLLIKTEFDPELEFIEADKQRFKQVLFNLLSNAVKFSKEEGGTITIATKKEGDMVKISVSDTGIGIKEENISKLFEKFEQLDSGISKKYGGTGLGLAITRQIVEMHGGKIRVESKFGEGSKFTFSLPIKAKKMKDTK